MRVLFIGCHCDDIELGCGATINKNKDNWEIFCKVLCNKGIVKNKLISLKKTTIKSLKQLGVKEKNIEIMNFKPNFYYKKRNKILNSLIESKQKIKPNLVFSQINDDHQDHETLYKETLRAFRDTNLCFYLSTLASKKNFKANLYEEISVKNLNKKINSIKKYKKKLGEKKFFEIENIVANARSNAIYVKKEYVEVFQVYTKINFV
jgi:LmbE family N-acetylglucosaminyl deacetylase